MGYHCKCVLQSSYSLIFLLLLLGNVFDYSRGQNSLVVNIMTNKDNSTCKDTQDKSETLLDPFHLLSSREELLVNVMKSENIETVFGADAVKEAPTYDENSGEYVGPERAMQSNIQFILYTSENPTKERQIYIGETKHLLASGFDPNAPTKIICHGFMSDYIQGPGYYLNPAYFESTKRPLNIILINWARMAGIHKTKPKPSTITKQWYDIFYFPPARNTEIVGNHTALLIEFLIREAGASLSHIHLIGHSLGSHVMGWAARALTLQEKIPRITALDPAAPCFENARILCFRGTYVSLSKNDATFVDVIHTHARCLGMRRAIGHVDFFPNSGFSQPGCHWFSFGMCSHRRAVELMAESIRFSDFNFLARKCDSWKNFIREECHATEFALLGEHCSAKSRGIFFLSTKKESPYIGRLVS